VRLTFVTVETDDGELRRFLGQSYAVVLRTVCLVADSDAAAEDAVQEAIARAWERRAQIQYLDRWVLAVALNLVRSRWRKLLRRPPAAGTRVRTGEEDMATAEWLMVLAALPPRQREVAVLHYVNDLPLALIAEVTGTSEGAVKNALYHARQKLARALTEEAEERTT
jgi:RNA polymerase sigma-70 factor (ECF subfamily)